MRDIEVRGKRLREKDMNMEVRGKRVRGRPKMTFRDKVEQDKT